MKQLSYQEYYDRVLGGWIGKFIGGTVGGPLEGTKSINNLDFYSELPEEIAAINDDNDFQLVWLHALQERGIHLTGEDLLEEWLEHIPFTFCEYGYAMKNFRLKIKPPVSGWFNNGYFKECMGCPVRSEIWGFICPGNPQLAVEYARKDGELDHAGDAVWAEMFLAAMDSLAFFEHNPGELIKLGLQFVPEDSQLFQCINDVIEWYRQGEHWLYTRQLLLNRYGSPDMTAALQNIGIMVLALLYGEGDFEKTMLTALNCGYDSDCTCATVGALLGVIQGARGIPAKWKEPVGDQFQYAVKLEREKKISGLTAEVCQIGILISQQLNKEVVITAVPPDLSLGAKVYPPQKVCIDVDYLGSPSISLGAAKKIAIGIKNETEEEISGKLTLTSPAGWEIESNDFTISLPPSRQKHVTFSLSLPKSLSELPMMNELVLTFSQAGKEIGREVFGLSGANIWLALGAFWQMLAESKLPPCPYPAHLWADPDTGETFKLTSTLPPVECMLGNEAEIEQEFLPESDIDVTTQPDLEKGVVFERRIIQVPEDRIDLDTVFPLKGPVVIYLLRYIKCSEKRKAWFMIGASDAVKVWLNDQLVHTSHNHYATNPFNHSVEVTLQEGINKLLVKLARCGDHFDFSFGFKEHHGRHWHQEQWMTDLADIPPWEVEPGLFTRFF